MKNIPENPNFSSSTKHRQQAFVKAQVIYMLWYNIVLIKVIKVVKNV